MKRFFSMLRIASLLLALGVCGVSAEVAEAEYTATGGNEAVLWVFISLCFVTLTVLVCFYRYRKKHYKKNEE